MLNRSNFMLMSLAVILSSMPAASAQVAGGNQQIFGDDQQMMQMQNSQIMQLQNQEHQYEQEVQAQDAKDNTYKTYAENRIAALQKIKNAHGSPALSMANEKQLYALQQWLWKEKETREQEQAHIKQLDKAIANLTAQRNGSYTNLNADINDMRGNQEQKAEDDKFNQMMKVNMFNELQSEMGAARWGGPPNDGYYNSVGGYGFQGGYGYSYGRGRRW
jgi:hypothetical protein